jgi:hypothetical protein
MKTTENTLDVTGKCTCEEHGLCCIEGPEARLAKYTAVLEYLEDLRQRQSKFRAVLGRVTEKARVTLSTDSRDPESLNEVISELITLVGTVPQEFRKQEELIRTTLPLI